MARNAHIARMPIPMTAQRMAGDGMAEE